MVLLLLHNVCTNPLMYIIIIIVVGASIRRIDSIVLFGMI
jgi:hypothetical protein